MGLSSGYCVGSSEWSGMLASELSGLIGDETIRGTVRFKIEFGAERRVSRAF